MIILAAANTLAANADAASQITCTVFGMELVSSVTEVYKTLYQGQLAAVAATIYTAPASNEVNIKSIALVNNDANASHQFKFFVNGTALVNGITNLRTIPAGGSANYEDGIGWQTFNNAGQLLTAGGVSLSPRPNYGVTGSKAETFDRHICDESNNAVLSTGRLSLQAIWLEAGTVINSISFYSGATALATGTNQLFGLYDGARNLLATTVNDGAAAWAANARKILALSAPYTVTSAGLYYLGIMVAATTVPTLKGQAAPTTSNLHGDAPIINGSSTTGLTTTLPNPAAAITVSTASAWGCVS